MDTTPARDHLPDYLITYLENRAAARADAVNATLGALTDRERALVKDAAVMGYVQGMRHPRDERIPKDGQILAHVVDACLAHTDLYPAIAAARPDNTGDRACMTP